MLVATSSVMNNLVESIRQFTGNYRVQAIPFFTSAVLSFLMKLRFDVFIINPWPPHTLYRFSHSSNIHLWRINVLRSLHCNGCIFEPGWFLIYNWWNSTHYISSYITLKPKLKMEITDFEIHFRFILIHTLSFIK